MDFTLCWCFLYAGKMGSSLVVDMELLLIYLYIRIYIYINIYTYIRIYILIYIRIYLHCAFVVLNNKPYKMYDTYIKLVRFIYFRK